MPQPLRLRRKPCEPGHGVMLRLAARQGARSSARVARDLGLDPREVLAGRHVADLAEAAGLDAAEIVRWSPVVDARARTVVLAGAELSLGDWSVGVRRFCPACLAADVAEAAAVGIPAEWFASHRAIWDVGSVAACPVHRCALLAACHVCGAAQGWRTIPLARCRGCGADLQTAPVVRASDPVGLYVAGRLESSSSGWPELDGLPLRHALRLLERLGLSSSIGPVASLPERSREAASAARAAGLLIAADLPAAFEAVLDAAIQRRTPYSPAGLGGAYGWIHSEWIGPDDPCAGPVRPLLLRHAVRNGVVAGEEPRLGNDVAPTLAMTAVARELGTGYERARALMEAVGAIPEGSRRGVAFTVDPAAIASVARSAARSSSRGATARRLRTGRAQVDGLLAAGLLRGCGEGRIDADSVAGLLASLDAQACAGAPPAGVSGICDAARDGPVPLWRICRAAVAGLLPFWHVDGDGLDAYAFRSVDVGGLKEPSADLSVEAAARELEVHPDCARALARCGTLTGPGARINRASVAFFNERYLPAAVLARAAGRSSSAIRTDLAAAGLEPAFDHRKCRQLIYRRSDLRRVGMLN